MSIDWDYERSRCWTQPKAGEPTPPATPQPETPDPWVNALRTALDAVEQTIQQQAEQIETLTQALELAQRWLANCVPVADIQGPKPLPVIAAALAALAGASRPTEREQKPDVVCEHGVALDVHCCNCHSGFIFDPNHECPPTEGEQGAPQ